MAALVKAVYQHGDLMRMAVATPGNDFRLGACEAPPALVSTHLGDDMTAFLEGYISKSCLLCVLIFLCWVILSRCGMSSDSIPPFLDLYLLKHCCKRRLYHVLLL